MKTITLTALLMSASLFFATMANAQSIEDVRWKTEEQVRKVLGEPNSISTPIGIHATYTMWQYDNFTVAFANSRAFHLFRKDSLTKFELEENR